jgi:predicted acylesterase/phospholipase RssA|tara:strand:- start:1006 stop:1866 length:861 start_codon:yes stop_codon:yes gene_type:complete
MTIKHLVISGGAHNGLYIFGTIKKLLKEKFFNIEDINSIYGTSVGSIIAAMLCLKQEWDIIFDYILNRPWNKDIFITPDMIFESITKKGVLGKSFMNIIFDKLLKARGLSTTITLKEFYNYSKINLVIFSVNANTFDIVKISHDTHPQLELIDALYMSSTMPFVFQPLFVKDICYIDGGCICHYPINYCVEDVDDTNEILGIKLRFKANTLNITETSNIFYFGFHLFNKLISNRQNKNISIENEINIDCNLLNASDAFDCINNKSTREKYIKEGESFAEVFLGIKG